jgi:hypothetical protein
MMMVGSCPEVWCAEGRERVKSLEVAHSFPDGKLGKARFSGGAHSQSGKTPDNRV